MKYGALTQRTLRANMTSTIARKFNCLLSSSVSQEVFFSRKRDADFIESGRKKFNPTFWCIMPIITLAIWCGQIFLSVLCAL